MIYDFTPYSTKQKLFDAYVDYMAKLQPHEYGIIRDADSIYTTSDYGSIIDYNIRNNPDIKCFTALTNRIGCSFQKDLTAPQGNDYELHRQHGIARQKKHWNKVRDVTSEGTMSGFWMCIRKDLFDKIPRPTTTRILHVDTHIAKSVHAMGEKTYLLQGIYLYHYYSNFDGVGERNKSHLA